MDGGLTDVCVGGCPVADTLGYLQCDKVYRVFYDRNFRLRHFEVTSKEALPLQLRPEDLLPSDEEEDEEEEGGGKHGQSRHEDGENCSRNRSGSWRNYSYVDEDLF